MSVLRTVLLGVCMCVCGWRDVAAIPRERLYPFGSDHGDSRLEEADDISSTEIALNVPVAFYDDVFYSIYVSIYTYLDHDGCCVWPSRPVYMYIHTYMYILQ